MKFVSVLFLLCLFCSSAFAGPLAGTYALHEQNDYFTLHNTDNNFTQGLQLSYTEPETDPEYRKFEVGQEIYTPNHKRLSPPLSDENPYAGFLYASGIQYYEHLDYRTQFGIKAGIVGPHAYGKTIQNGVHRMLGQREPAGWDYQLKDEPILNLMHKREWVNFDIGFLGYELNSVSSIENNLGNQLTNFVYVNGFKLGKNVPRYDFSKSRNAYYLFSNIATDVVARNIYYDGNTFRDSPHVTTSHVVFLLDSGIGFEYRAARLKFHYIINTREYEEQKEQFHNYGFVDLNFKF